MLKLKEIIILIIAVVCVDYPSYAQVMNPEEEYILIKNVIMDCMPEDMKLIGMAIVSSKAYINVKCTKYISIDTFRTKCGSHPYLSIPYLLPDNEFSLPDFATFKINFSLKKK